MRLNILGLTVLNERNWMSNILLSLKMCFASKFRNLMVKCMPELADLLEPGNKYLWHHSVGNSQISPKAKIMPIANIGDVIISDYTYVARGSVIHRTTIGKCCSIGPNLFCGWGIHPTNGISTHPMFYSRLRQNGMTLSSENKIEELKPITIGNDVFIGANVTILDGVTIGDGAVIGAGTVVSKDIPPYAVAVGCPIRIVRYRFADDKIEKLRKIEWWNFDEEKLKDVERMFFDVDEFIERYG